MLVLEILLSDFLLNGVDYVKHVFVKWGIDLQNIMIGVLLTILLTNYLAQLVTG